MFAELAIIRSHEFGVPTPWARLAAWIRRMLGRPQHVRIGWASSFEVANSLRAKQRPADAAPEASESERIARLERYVDCLDRDVDQLHEAIDRRAQELTEAVQRRGEALRREVEQREEQRRDALRPSLYRQATGGACVFVGLVFATLGGVL